MQIVAYSVDDVSSISYNQCLVGLSMTSNFPKDSVVRITSGDGSTLQVTYLTVCFDQRLEDNIVMHQWVFDTHHFTPGNEIILDIVSKECLDPQPRDVTLEFQCALSLLSIDEITNTFCLPSSWSRVWPHGAKRELLQLVTPAMLIGTCISNGGLLCMRALSNYMIFKCKFDGGEADSRPFLYNGDATVRISGDSHVDNTARETSGCDHRPCPRFMKSCYARLSAVCHMCVTSRVTQEWRGPHSAIVLGPIGSGKTTLLSRLTSAVERKYEASDIMARVHIVRISCKTTSFTDGVGKISDTLSGLGHPEPPCPEGVAKAVRRIVHPFSVGDKQANDIMKTWEVTAGTNSFPPLILILEDIDEIIRSQRSYDSDSAASEVSASLQSSLVELLDIISQPDFGYPICVIASASAVESDISSRYLGSPGFEVVTVIPPPSCSDRQDILASMLSSVENSSTRAYTLGNPPAVSFSSSDELFRLAGNTDTHKHMEWSLRCARMTAGYLPGDLYTLVSRMCSICEGQTSKQSKTKPSPNCIITVEWAHFLTSLAMTAPRQLLNLRGSDEDSAGGIVVEDRNATLQWRNFAGYDMEKSAVKAILDRVSSMHNDDYTNADAVMSGSSLQVGSPRGLVIWGPPGCGKSYLARIIAAEANMNFVSVRSTSLLSKYFGQTEASLRLLFRKARAAAPCVLFFDDFDAIAHNRGNFDHLQPGGGFSDGGGGEVGVTARVLSTFLNELDGVTSASISPELSHGSSSIFVLAACADIATLDKALCRPGRLSHNVYLGKPSRRDVDAILAHYLSSMPLDQGLSATDITDLKEFPRDPTPADISAICREALQVALKESVDIASGVMDKIVVTAISKRHFVIALQIMFPAEKQLEFPKQEFKFEKGQFSHGSTF